MESGFRGPWGDPGGSAFPKLPTSMASWPPGFCAHSLCLEGSFGLVPVQYQLLWEAFLHYPTELVTPSSPMGFISIQFTDVLVLPPAGERQIETLSLSWSVSPNNPQTAQGQESPLLLLS